MSPPGSAAGLCAASNHGNGMSVFVLESGNRPSQRASQSGLFDSSPFGQNCHVYPGKDLWHMRSLLFTEPVDFLIGNTYGKYIARDENIPFVRHGFPILDRIGHSYFPTVGYRGAMRLAEKILGVLMDRQDREAPEESFELVM